MSIAMGLFMHAVFQDGTLAPVRSPEELLEVLNTHEKRVEGTNAFLVTASEELNELAPVEVLAGRFFKVHADEPGRVVCGEDGRAKVVPYTANDLLAHRRMLERSVEDRAASVIAVAKRWGLDS